jgi:hypothetical protein
MVVKNMALILLIGLVVEVSNRRTGNGHIRCDQYKYFGIEHAGRPQWHPGESQYLFATVASVTPSTVALITR